MLKLNFINAKSDTSFFDSDSSDSSTAVPAFTATGTNGNRELCIISSTTDLVHKNDHQARMMSLSRIHERILSFVPSHGKLYSGDDVGAALMTDLTDVPIVDYLGRVRVPRDYIKLMQGEHIVAVHGYLYHMTNMDLIKCLLTLGLFYCFVVHKKRRCRTAIFLTTARILVANIEHDQGLFPKNADDVKVSLSSYLPREVYGGSISTEPNIGILAVMLSKWFGSCYSATNIVSSTLSCETGFFKVPLPAEEGLKFAKQFQLINSRVMCPTTKVIPRAADADTCLNEAERKYIPLVPDEVIIRRYVCNDPENPLYEGAYQPCCCCEENGLCFPAVPLYCTCGHRPFIQRSDVIITDHSLYAINFYHSKPWYAQPLNEDRVMIGN